MALVTCPECNGSGEVEYCDEDEHGQDFDVIEECESCDGSGEVCDAHLTVHCPCFDDTDVSNES